MLGNVIFFGRKKCKYTYLLEKYLRKNSKKLIFFESDRKSKNINIKKLKKEKIDFIFCFRSFYILKKNLLKKCKVNAINFHPGLPSYRGIGAINFAIKKNEKYFGCTAHFINEKIDSGKILDVIKFKINKKDDLDCLLKKTHKNLYILSKKVIKNVIIDNFHYLKLQNKKSYVWSKKLYTLKELNKLYEIKMNLDKNLIKTIMRATYTKKYKPYIIINNNKYHLINEN
jgi:methionyl-tRNA formyltransferase